MSREEFDKYFAEILFNSLIVPELIQQLEDMGIYATINIKVNKVDMEKVKNGVKNAYGISEKDFGDFTISAEENKTKKE